MKKLISVFLVMALVLTNFQGWDCIKQLDLSKKLNLFQGIEQSYAETINGIYYEVSNGKITIKDVDTSISGDLVIPETIEGYPVTSIGDAAFCNCKNLQSISISEGVITIGNSAFLFCTSLKSISIPKSVTTIGNSAFECCSSLESINLPEGITAIGDSAFYSCTSLKSINLSKNITIIKGFAFCDCENLESVNLPEGVTTIGDHAFWDCKNLKSIFIPRSVITIGPLAFYYENNLTIYGYSNSYAETYAKKMNISFVAIQENLKIIFNPNNGQNSYEKEILKDTTLDYISKIPTKEGYTFVGWYKDIDDTATEYKNNSTYDQDLTYTAKWAHVQMLGAQGKVIVDDKSGIRFGTKIYDDGDEIVEKGTLIIPVSVLGDQKLTLQTLKVAKSVANVLYDENKEENYVTYLGTLVGIPRSQFGAEITASSYVIYRDKAGNEYTVYSPYKKGSTTINKLLGL